MASPATSWRELVPGIVFTTAVIAAVWAVLVFARVGALRGDTIELLAPVSSARNVFVGTEVLVAGFPVGKVRSIQFRPPSTDTSARLLMRLEVVLEHAGQIRRDSYAQIRSGGSLVGSPVVFINPGTPGAAALGDGDTLRTMPQFDTEGISSQVAIASREFPEIIENLRVIAGHLGGGEGSVGSVIGDGRQQFSVAGARAGAIARSIERGEGSIGLALRSGGRGPMARAQALISGADTLRTMLAGESTALGRFRRDSTLLREVRALLDDVSLVRALIGEPRGTAGRALHDPVVYDQLGQLERELSALMADLRARPLRYIVF